MMATKNMYMFKIIIRDTSTGNELPPPQYRSLFSEIIANNSINHAITLTHEEDVEPITLDVLENTDEYLFCRLNKKKPNNTMQKRNYVTQEISDVLTAEEVANSGVEWFTYCIIGYTHGVMSIINSKGAPNDRAFARLFAKYMNRYKFETEAIPNNELVRELLDGQTPHVTKIFFEIARPNLQFLEGVLGFSDDDLLEAVSDKTSSISFTIKPDLRGSLLKNRGLIASLIRQMRDRRQGYSAVKITGKANDTERQREYDLYEEYFKYPITVEEFRQEGGRRVERNKDLILRDYRREMMIVYNQHKDVILAMSNRL